MSANFAAQGVTRVGSIVLEGAVDEVFPLFGPVDEKKWVAGWEPEVVYPAWAEMEQGMVFRTRDGEDEFVWVMTHLDRARHEVEYHNVAAGFQVRRIEVRCRPLTANRTEATVAYSYVGLSERGNQELAAMDESAYAEKMKHWEQTINNYLRNSK